MFHKLGGSARGSSLCGLVLERCQKADAVTVQCDVCLSSLVQLELDCHHRPGVFGHALARHKNSLCPESELAFRGGSISPHTVPFYAISPRQKYCFKGKGIASTSSMGIKNRSDYSLAH